VSDLSAAERAQFIDYLRRARRAMADAGRSAPEIDAPAA
jgi:hypothetical protein